MQVPRQQRIPEGNMAVFALISIKVTIIVMAVRLQRIVFRRNNNQVNGCSYEDFTPQTKGYITHWKKK